MYSNILKHTSLMIWTTWLTDISDFVVASTRDVARFCFQKYDKSIVQWDLRQTQIIPYMTNKLSEHLFEDTSELHQVRMSWYKWQWRRIMCHNKFSIRFGPRDDNHSTIPYDFISHSWGRRTSWTLIVDVYYLSSEVRWIWFSTDSQISLNVMYNDRLEI